MSINKTLFMSLTYEMSLSTLEKLAEDPEQEAVYSIGTCWWSLWDDKWMPYNRCGIPLDPSGSPLMQAPLKKFLENALANEKSYGKHGMDAFVAAFHGNVRRWDGEPLCFKEWERYNNLLDSSIPSSPND